MADKKPIVLPADVAREIVCKSIARFGDSVEFDPTVTLFQLGLKSKSDLIDFGNVIAVEIAKAVPGPADPKLFVTYLRIQPTNTCGQVMRGVQKAYTLGLAGDVIPPDYDDPI